ncbi:MAG: hypothetical protein AAFW75_32590, partial [Cyanobacteria bacterium J06636_16]
GKRYVSRRLKVRDLKRKFLTRIRNVEMSQPWKYHLYQVLNILMKTVSAKEGITVKQRSV